MDPIRKERLLLHKRVESIIRNVEDDEATMNETKKTILASKSTSIGPANDLLRFFYILDQQNQSDTNDVREKSKDDLLSYINQYRSSENADEDLEEQEENQDDVTRQQPTLINPSNPQPLTTVSKSSLPVTILQPPQPMPVVPTPPLLQPAPVVPILPPSQPTPVVPILPPSQPTPVVPVPLQPSPSIERPSLPSVATTGLNNIRPDTLTNYRKLLSEAQQYERRYSTITGTRKKQLAAPLKAIINRLREDTFTTLTDELLTFLNGKEQIIVSQVIRISNEDERLLCLSMIASLVFNQLLGSDLDDVKTRILLPLVGLLSENQQHKEFRTIFLDRLHKKCPYTVPYYPERQSTMSDKEYFEALGYVEKKEGDKVRLETDNEFLNRMSGLIRFFCKLLVRRGPPFDNKLTYAWLWMSDVLNLPPRPNITAVILRIFLNEVGDSMLKEYSKQFLKITQTIETQYIPRMKSITTEDQITRLQLSLDPFKKIPT